VNTIIERTKAALDGDQRAADLDELAVELRMYVKTQGGRLKDITAKDMTTFGQNRGPERVKVVEAGDVAALLKLDEEERTLGPEIEVLRSLQNRLRTHLDATRAAESVEAAPARYAAIAAALGAEGKAKAALEAAIADTEALIQDVSARRQHVALHGGSIVYPVANESLLRLFMHTRQYAFYRSHHKVGWFSPTRSPRQLKLIADALGVPVPTGVRPAA
jgi:hypothetical protein